jgi:hypothetical protein
MHMAVEDSLTGNFPTIHANIEAFNRWVVKPQQVPLLSHQGIDGMDLCLHQTEVVGCIALRVDEGVSFVHW